MWRAASRFHKAAGTALKDVIRRARPEVLVEKPDGRGVPPADGASKSAPADSFRGAAEASGSPWESHFQASSHCSAEKKCPVASRSPRLSWPLFREWRKP